MFKLEEIKPEEYVGVRDFSIILHPSELLKKIKRDLLLFDKIIIDNYSYKFEPISEYYNETGIGSEFKWLFDQHILYGTSGYDLIYQATCASTVALLGIDKDICSQVLPEDVVNDVKLFRKSIRFFNGGAYDIFHIRSLGAILRHYFSINAIPIHDIFYPSKLQIPKHDIIQLVLKQFPLLYSATPIHEVIEFREKHRDKLIRLRRWIRELTRAGVLHNEIVAEINELLFLYSEDMKRKDILAGLIKKEIYLVGTQDLFKLGFGDVVAKSYSLKKVKVQLLDQEAQAEGREVAYIDVAQKHFNPISK